METPVRKPITTELATKRSRRPIFSSPASTIIRPVSTARVAMATACASPVKPASASAEPAVIARALVAATFMKAELPKSAPSGVPIMMA